MHALLLLPTLRGDIRLVPRGLKLLPIGRMPARLENQRLLRLAGSGSFIVALVLGNVFQVARAVQLARSGGAAAAAAGLLVLGIGFARRQEVLLLFLVFSLVLGLDIAAGAAALAVGVYAAVALLPVHAVPIGNQGVRAGTLPDDF